MNSLFYNQQLFHCFNKRPSILPFCLIVSKSMLSQSWAWLRNYNGNFLLLPVQVAMLILIFIFAIVHSGLASLRDAGEKLIGERAFRVLFAGISLPLAVSTVVNYCPLLLILILRVQCLCIVFTTLVNLIKLLSAYMGHDGFRFTSSITDTMVLNCGRLRVFRESMSLFGFQISSPSSFSTHLLLIFQRLQQLTSQKCIYGKQESCE